MIAFGGGCGRHGEALVEFVDRGEIGPRTHEALAHLDRCARCSDALESTILTVAALRRLGDEVATAEPRADAWTRLRARLDDRRPARPSIVRPMAGTAMAMALVTLLLASLQISGARSGPAEDAATVAGQNAIGQPIAADKFDPQRHPVTVRVVLVQFTAAARRSFPDGIDPEQKEVGRVEPNGRPLEAI